MVSLSTTNCYYGLESVAVGADGNVWFSDYCSNLYAVPVANFTPSAVQSWSVAGVTNDNSFGWLIATSGGIQHR